MGWVEFIIGQLKSHLIWDKKKMVKKIIIGVAVVVVIATAAFSASLFYAPYRYERFKNFVLSL